VMADAEDVVQEAWLRWQRVAPGSVDNPAAWLTTTTARLALDRLRAVARRRESYVGPWLPEPISTDPDPERSSELAESLTLAFLCLLDRLGPVERTVFLLADVFDEPYRTIAGVVGRSEAACRQIASRARRRVRDGAPPQSDDADPAVLARLVAAVSAGDVPVVVSLLDPAVRLVSDGGAHHHAARRPVIGPQRVARLLVNLVRRAGRTPDVDIRPVLLNDRWGLVGRDGTGHLYTFTAQTEGGRVHHIQIVVNPDKLRHLDRPVTLR